MTRSLRILYLGTDGRCEVRLIDHTLGALRAQVEGGVGGLFVAEFAARDLKLYSDSEGLAHGHARNPFSRHLGQPAIAGPIIALRGSPRGGNVSLTDADVAWLQRYFAAPDDDDDDVIARLRQGQTVVVNYHTDRALIKRAESEGLLVRIDRRSPWGNPFEMPGDGDRLTVIRNYEEHYLPYKPSLLGRLGELRGKALACWCAPAPCHGDVLKAWAHREACQG
jgi:hypothetical protein